VIQAGAWGLLASINRFGEMFALYISPQITYEYRKKLNDQEQWLKDEDDTFQYGYFYSVMCCVLGIVLVFAPVMPEIAMAGVIYLSLTHCAHFHQLLCVHKFEMESSGQLVHNACCKAFICLL
jgi:hypothetical protein